MSQWEYQEREHKLTIVTFRVVMSQSIGGSAACIQDIRKVLENDALTPLYSFSNRKPSTKSHGLNLRCWLVFWWWNDWLEKRAAHSGDADKTHKVHLAPLSFELRWFRSVAFSPYPICFIKRDLVRPLDIAVLDDGTLQDRIQEPSGVQVVLELYAVDERNLCAWFICFFWLEQQAIGD
ncbi:hypothetical protein BDV93DRAFT_514219 [Ceratobasidium sp. AG-I]|nr:hypothetical protein BDV93DRAFT_514219 [Ceratobasidium sp. AG-I]